jgi:putative spermidine/putrescine transport system ATP-binding protein
VTVMREGRVLQTGAPRDIYRDPASHAVAAFVGHANLFAGEALDGSTVRTALGVLRSRGHGFAAGASVSVLIRPEAIRPAADGQAVNRLEGRVTRDRFFGSLRRFDFTCDAGVTLLCEMDAAEAPPQAIGIPPDAVQLIAPEEQGQPRPH